MIELYGEAIYADSTIWITSGDGSFNDANLLNATYTPGENDILNGSVELTLEALASEVCEGDDSDVLTLVVDNCTSIDEQQKTSRISVIPNPSDGYFTLSVSNETVSEISWELINNLGKTLLKSTGSVRKAVFEDQVNASQLKSGTYFLQITIGDKVFTEKVLIQE